MQTEARVGVVEGGGASSHKLVTHHHRRSQIGAVSQLIAGGVAGAVSKTCTAPLARLTILFQVQGMHSDVSTLRKASILREASRIVTEEGFRAFWKGNLVTIAHRLPYSSISFYAFECYKNMLLQLMSGAEGHESTFGSHVFVRLAGGGLSGITAASVTYPLDLVRTRLSAQTNVDYYRGIWHALCTISREEGIFGLYKGLGACLLGVGPNLAISFTVYDTVRSYWQLQRPNDSTIMVSLACGSLSGIASSTEARSPANTPWDLVWRQYTYFLYLVSFPLDLVRRRMQLEGAGGRARVYKTGAFGTFKHILQAEGIRGLYRGILPEYYKVVPSIGIVFMTYEKLKQVLSEIDT